MTPSPTTMQGELTPEVVTAFYRTLEESLPGPAGDSNAWEVCYWRWNDFRRRIAGETTRRYFKEAQNGGDTVAEEAARYIRECIHPLQEAGDARMREVFLREPQRTLLESRLGTYLFLRLALDQAGFATENIALMTQEGEATSQYERLWGAASLEVAGQSVTVSKATAMLNGPDETERRAAWEAIAAFGRTQRERLHGLYDELVGVRHQMALNLGEPDFIGLGYRKMGRTDYGPDQIAVFREEIRTHAVPMLARLRKAQAGWLNKPLPQGWDLTHFPGLSLGPGVVPIDNQLKQASTLFGRLHPRLAQHFDRMVAEGLIDLESRPGKRPGAFAVTLDDEDRVVIFCNSTSAETDVATLTHEMGHAFQAWESLWIRPLDLRLPTLDAAELTSMGMEFLALKEIEAFFTPEQATSFRRLKLTTTLTRLPYMALVDAFQHWVYANPRHTHAEREATWASLWEEFTPGVDLAGEADGVQARWLRQSHIFCCPFYYIDYAIAEVGALQLWRLARQDHDAAMESYLKLCTIGGTQSVLGIFAHAGLQSPFQPGVLGPLMEDLAAELGI